jgi:hypothetical protein
LDVGNRQAVAINDSAATRPALIRCHHNVPLARFSCHIQLIVGANGSLCYERLIHGGAWRNTNLGALGANLDAKRGDIVFANRENAAWAQVQSHSRWGLAQWSREDTRDREKQRELKDSTLSHHGAYYTEPLGHNIDIGSSSGWGFVVSNAQKRQIGGNDALGILYECEAL